MPGLITGATLRAVNLPTICAATRTHVHHSNLGERERPHPDYGTGKYGRFSVGSRTTANIKLAEGAILQSNFLQGRGLDFLT
jgi:hypothetical protein